MGKYLLGTNVEILMAVNCYLDSLYEKALGLYASRIYILKTEVLRL